MSEDSVLEIATISVVAAWTTLVLFEGVICFLD